MALLVATLLGAGVSSASPNPGDPGYCGARQDALDCVAYDGPAPPSPSRAEAAYLSSVRGHYPGDDATLLKIGRGTCNMLRGGVSVNYIVPDIAGHLGISNAAADQVMDAAMGSICPEIHIGANGADDSGPH
ncbi:MAG: DUF732 domain-containing protein [Mycobacterium sp.]|uniref:DUF732 domain-containing protein n=1 Tax=Mycobacterium sp. TaxID=1785 RepID=UPI003F95537D